MATLTRKEHGEERSGKITSSVASLLLTGTKKSWERLAQHLDDPPPFYAPTSGPMADGVQQEPLIVNRWMARHPEVEVLEHPVVLPFHDKCHKAFDLLATSPDRIADGIPVEVKFATKRARYDKLSKHLDRGNVPAEHLPQVMWHAWCTGVGKCWFVVGTERQLADALFESDDLSIIDRRLEMFLDQYRQYKIVGVGG